jgi:hypothetical protein
VTAASLREFAERTRFRADTALALISDSEFLEGQAAIGGQFAAVAGFVLDRAREKGSAAICLRNVCPNAAVIWANYGTGRSNQDWVISKYKTSPAP